MPQTISPEDAAEFIRPSDTLGVPLGPGVPGRFMHALGGREAYDDLRLFGALLPDLYEVLMRPGVSMRSGFFGPAERFLVANGAPIEFVPAGFRGFGPTLQDLAPRVMATAASPPDSDGWMSLSLHAGASVDELHRAASDPDRLCVAEIAEAFPRTLGLPPKHRHALHVDEVDIIVDGGDTTPFELADNESSEVDEAIAEYAAAFIPDGATLQTGIGGIPNSVASLLARGSGSGYGIHSEMFTTGLMRLCQAGKVTNTNKGEFDGVSVTTFAAGTSELYEWLDGNEDVRFLPVDIVNSPEAIAANEHMVTINGAMSIDLAGQVIADTIDGTQFSGIGGHEDFIAGPGLDLTDRSLVCLPATATCDGQLVSRITGRSAAGSIVTTPRHQLDVVITEFGVAEIGGHTVRERARAIASIANPDFRDELLDEAERWP